MLKFLVKTWRKPIVKISLIKEEETMVRHFLKLASAMLMFNAAAFTYAQSDGIYFAAHHDYRVVEVAVS